MTIPVLTANHKKIEYAAKLKKFYNTMVNAYDMAETDYDLSPSRWTITGSDSKTYFETYLAPYLKYTKIVEESGHLQRFDYTAIVYFDDGTRVFLQDFAADRYMRMLFDVNGDKEPNSMGRDLFQFWYSWNNVFTTYYPWNSDSYNTRTKIKQMCSSNVEQHFHCAKLVQLDGWEFKDDYPVKL